jgi:hypothetical protein
MLAMIIASNAYRLRAIKSPCVLVAAVGVAAFENRSVRQSRLFGSSPAETWVLERPEGGQNKKRKERLLWIRFSSQPYSAELIQIMESLLKKRSVEGIRTEGNLVGDLRIPAISFKIWTRVFSDIRKQLSESFYRFMRCWRLHENAL